MVSAVKYRAIESEKLAESSLKDALSIIDEVKRGQKFQYSFNFNNICAAKMNRIAVLVRNVISKIQIVCKVDDSSHLNPKCEIQEWSINSLKQDKALVISSRLLPGWAMYSPTKLEMKKELRKDIGQSVEHSPIELNRLRWRVNVAGSSQEDIEQVMKDMAEKGFKPMISRPYFTVETEDHHTFFDVRQDLVVETSPDTKDACLKFSKKAPQKELFPVEPKNAESLETVLKRIDEQLLFIAQKAPRLRLWAFDISTLSQKDREPLLLKMRSRGFASVIGAPTIKEAMVQQYLWIPLPEAP